MQRDSRQVACAAKAEGSLPLDEGARQAASDIYLDLGFDDLSHFSYAFKKESGEAPLLILG
jgi:AraC-like DNA-binding protein